MIADKTVQMRNVVVQCVDYGLLKRLRKIMSKYEYSRQYTDMLIQLYINHILKEFEDHYGISAYEWIAQFRQEIGDNCEVYEV